jgi:hypothetical protein
MPYTEEDIEILRANEADLTTLKNVTTLEPKLILETKEESKYKQNFYKSNKEEVKELIDGFTQTKDFSYIEI